LKNIVVYYVEAGNLWDGPRIYSFYSFVHWFGCGLAVSRGRWSILIKQTLSDENDIVQLHFA